MAAKRPGTQVLPGRTDPAPANVSGPIMSTVLLSNVIDALSTPGAAPRDRDLGPGAAAAWLNKPMACLHDPAGVLPSVPIAILTRRRLGLGAMYRVPTKNLKKKRRLPFKHSVTYALRCV